MIVERWLVTLLLVIWAAAPIGALEISVKDHGAKGDGRADDGPAIRAAINVVRKAGGGTITFPEGIYRVTAPKRKRGRLSSRFAVVSLSAVWGWSEA